MVQLGNRGGDEMISKEAHQEETERLRMEIQQCKDFIQTQQQLLQVHSCIDLSDSRKASVLFLFWISLLFIHVCVVFV